MPADRLRVEPALLDPDVAAVDDRRDRRRVGRRPADPVLLERLDQRRLGEARRRLGEVLGRRDVADVGPVALGQRRQATLGLVVLGRVVVAALGVDAGEPVEQRPRRVARSSYGPAASSTVVVSSSLAAICEASARCQISRYRRSSSGLSMPASESGSRRKQVGRIDSCASWAPFDFVL